MMSVKKWEDVVFLICSFVFTAILIFQNFDILSLPLFGDEKYYAKAFSGNVFRDIFVDNFGHPPLWNFQINFFYYLFGKTPFITHSISLFYSISLLLSVGYISKKLYDMKVSFLTMSALFFFTTFQREAYLYYSENVMLLFSLWGAYFFSLREDKKALLFYIVATLFRENAIAFPVASFLVRFIQTKSIRESIIYFYALIPLAIFFLISFIVDPSNTLNTEFQHRSNNGFSFFTLNWSKIDSTIYYIKKTIDFGLYTFLALFMLGVFFIFNLKEKTTQKNFNCTLLLTAVFSISFFTLYNDYAARDLMNFAVVIIFIGSLTIYKLKSHIILVLLTLSSLLLIDMPKTQKRMKYHFQVTWTKRYLDIYSRLNHSKEASTLVSHNTYTLLTPIENGYGDYPETFTKDYKKASGIKYIISSNIDALDYLEHVDKVLKNNKHKLVVTFRDDNEYINLFKLIN